MSDRRNKPTHKYHLDQTMTVDNELFSGRVVIRACLNEVCEAHSLPRYGVSAGDRHFSFCEDVMTPTKFN